MSRLSTKAHELLTRAGWSETRRHDLSGWERELAERREAFAWTAVVREFLTEFGGLDVDPTLDESDFCLDLDGILGYDADNLYEYSKFLGKTLFPIGLARGGSLVLGMAPDGSVYGGCAESVVRIASSPLEALENLCTGGPFEKLR